MEAPSFHTAWTRCNGMDSSSPTASRCQTEGANQTVNGEKESTHEA